MYKTRIISCGIVLSTATILYITYMSLKASLEHDCVMVSNSIAGNNKSLAGTLSLPNTLSLDDPDLPDPSGSCTLERLRQMYAAQHKFPDAGHWVDNGSHTRYIPELCQLKYSSIPATVLRECLDRSNLR